MSTNTRPDAPDSHDDALRFKALDAGLWTYDIDSDELICDAQWHAMLQLPAGSITCVEAFSRFIHPDDMAVATRVDPLAISDMIALDQRYHVDFRVIRNDGAVRWWRSVACLIVDEQSGHRRAVGCVTDTTDIAHATTPVIPAPAMRSDAAEPPPWRPLLNPIGRTAERAGT